MNPFKNLIVLLSMVLLTQTAFAQLFSKATVRNLNFINSGELDFSPAFHNDGLVFVSNNVVKGKEKIYDKEIGKRTMSLFIARKNNKGQLQKPEPFAIELVSALHEGPLSFDNTCQTVYFTRNDNVKNGQAKYNEGIDHLKIYTAQLTHNGWSVPVEFPFNEEKSDACHPTLSADGTTLYFASNRAGGEGGMDIYVTKKVDDVWTTPVNLGENVNSEKEDVFPFIHEDSTLYFSSNREGGFGGMDIYYAKLTDKTDKKVYRDPTNIGKPFNSDKDDFGFILDSERKTGYFTSNRLGGVGEDDNYSFVLPEELRDLTIIVLDRKTRISLSKADVSGEITGKIQHFSTDDKGKTVLHLPVSGNYLFNINKTDYTAEQISISKEDKKTEITVLMDNTFELPRTFTLTVLDQKTNTPLSNVEVCLINTAEQSPKAQTATGNCEKFTTDANGKVQLKVIPANNYFIKINKTAFNPAQAVILKMDKRSEITISLTKISEIVATIEATKPEKIIAKPEKSTPKTSKFIDLPESDYDQVYCLKHIYYDFNKDNIRADAQIIMDSLLEILNHFSEMEIEMAAHADTRGNAKYNQDLSERRVANAANYLKKNGISSQRLRPVALGKGKTIECPPGMTCTEEMLFQLNRSTEIKLIKKGRLGRGKVIEASHGK